jgi:hypothetical protein
MYWRCRLTDKPIADGSWPIDENITRLCSGTGDGQFYCPNDRTCGHPLYSGYPVPMGSENISNSELIQYGIVTFDNIGIGIVTIFQAITLEGWTLIMYNVIHFI